MPLQSGSDRILRAMNRNYRRAKYLNIIEALKKRVPDMAITTDIIVGFPGETEQDFQETLEVMEIVQFDNSYSFIFSPRPGTVAAQMEELISHEEKLARLQTLQAKQEEIMARRLSAWVGKITQVLVDHRNQVDERCFAGRISQNYTVNLQQSHGGLKLGDLIDVCITGSNRFTLMADLVSSK
jgi:tRNA-2-methylthio-N6-dimethylallyladenosine synthase